MERGAYEHSTTYLLSYYHSIRIKVLVQEKHIVQCTTLRGASAGVARAAGATRAAAAAAVGGPRHGVAAARV